MNPTAFALLVIPALVLPLAQAEPLRFDSQNPWASVEIHAAEPMLAQTDERMPPTAPPPLPTPPSVGTDEPADDGTDADSRDDESILERERAKRERESGSGTDGVDGQMSGSGTDSESVPDEVKPGPDE